MQFTLNKTIYWYYNHFSLEVRIAGCNRVFKTTVSKTVSGVFIIKLLSVCFPNYLQKWCKYLSSTIYITTLV